MCALIVLEYIIKFIKHPAAISFSRQNAAISTPQLVSHLPHPPRKRSVRLKIAIGYL